MENEKFQNLVLKQLKILTDGQERLEFGQKALGDRQEALESGQRALETRQEALEFGQKDLREDVKELKSRFIRFENDIIPKVNILLNGWKQNSEKLERIEEQVSKHEEFILKRIK